MHRFALRWFILLALVGCGQPNASSSPAPAGAAAATPTAPVVATPPATPSLAAPWEPPLPQPAGQPLPRPTAVPGQEQVRYEVVGLGRDTTLSVRDTGLVVLDDGGQRITMTLPLTERADLRLRLAAMPHDLTTTSTIQPDPDGVIVEMDYRTITIPGHGMVTLRGAAGTPAAVPHLENWLVALADRVRTEGSHPPAIVLSYFLETADMESFYAMEINAAGTVFIGTPAGTLSADELTDLLAGLSSTAFATWDDWYMPPPEARHGPAARAIITYLPGGRDHHWVNLVSGAEVPPELQRLLTHLTDIYSRYAPPK